MSFYTEEDTVVMY